MGLPFHGFTGLPAGVPVVVFGDGNGSYWRLVENLIRKIRSFFWDFFIFLSHSYFKSQYCVYDPFFKR